MPKLVHRILPEGSSYRNQRDKLLTLLVAANGGWVPLPEVLALNIAQYSSRVHELRMLGFAIQSRTERRDGKVHSFFRLDVGTLRTTEPSRLEPQGTLFDIAPVTQRDCG